MNFPMGPVIPPGPVPPQMMTTELTAQPTAIICPVCYSNVVTVLRYRSGILTWLIAALCILCGCFLGCCLIPFCIRGLKNVEHICPNCNSVIGVYKRL